MTNEFVDDLIESMTSVEELVVEPEEGKQHDEHAVAVTASSCFFGPIFSSLYVIQLQRNI